MSEAERAEEQSLEEILSTIRKKISADPDMSAPAHPDTESRQPLSQAKAGRLHSDISALGTSAPGITSSQEGSKSESGAFPGGLSNVLGRIDAAEQEEDAATAPASDDDLSDLLDDPLPDPLQPVRSWNKSTESESSDTSSTAQNPISSWPPIGMTTGEEAADFGASRDNTGSTDDASSTIEGGSLTARLKATSPFQSSSEPASSKTSALPGETSSGSGETQESVPRSMSALSSGFVMVPEMSSLPTDNSGSGVKLESETDEPAARAHATFGATAATPSADTPASPTTETVTSLAPETADPAARSGQTSSSAGARLNLSVSASKAQPLATPSDDPTVLPASQPEKAAATPAPASPTATSTAAAFTSGQNQEMAAATTSALAGALGSASATEQGINALSQNKTVEQMVQDMLRPMLHEWLEANLPRIVENALRIEVSQASKAVPKDAADQ